MAHILFKISAYLKNKYYNFLHLRNIQNNAKTKLFNYLEYLSGVKNQEKSKKFILKFKDGYSLICPSSDLCAIGETCLTEDYQKYKEWKIKKGDIVFDVGAHIGSFSIYAANKGAKVYAFEPDKKNYQNLLKNIKLNNAHSQIIPFNFGIYSSDGKLSFYTSLANPAGNSTISDANKKEKKIQVKKLSTIFKMIDVKKIDLLKMDIEGSEYEIFEKLTDSEFNKIEKIVGEYHLFPYKPDWNFRHLKNLLKKHYSVIKHCNPYYFYTRK